MRWGALFLAVLLLLGLPAGAPAQKERRGKDKDKPPDLEIVEFSTQRDGKTIVVDGRVRNISAKPMRGVVLFFELLESDNKMISRLTAEVTKAEVGPGEEAAFEAQTRDHSRAVFLRLIAEDAHGRYLMADKPGPYEIE